MMTEDTATGGGGDVENPMPAASATTDAQPSNAAAVYGGGSSNDPNKKMKAIALSSFLLVAVVLAIVLGVTLGPSSSGEAASNVNAPSGGTANPTDPTDPITASSCFVGDIMYQEGDSIWKVGWECINSTTYDGTESTCGPDGEEILAEMQYTCPESAPYCVQCGSKKERGNAMCLSTPTTDDCGESTSPATTSVGTTTLSSVQSDPTSTQSAATANTLQSSTDLTSTQTSLSTATTFDVTTSNPTSSNLSSSSASTMVTSTATTLSPNEDETTTEPSNAETTATQPAFNGNAPQEVQYLKSIGPIPAQVRMINPSVANGYSSCNDLKNDIESALKYYANKIIVQQKKYDSHAQCDPNKPEPDYNYDDCMYYGAVDAVAESAPAMAADSAFLGAGAPPDKLQEDSFETNNQVDGVDEADIAKSDGEHVYAAYGDVLYVWKAENGTEGVSITKMPYEPLTNCTWNPRPCGPYPMPIALEETVDSSTGEAEPVELPTEEAVSSVSSGFAQGATSSSPGGIRHKRARRNRDLSMIAWHDPCYKPKPNIVSLLLKGKRLTVIVSEGTNFGYPEKNDDEKSVISDNTKLTIKIYDISLVPTDGSPLKLLAEREIKGNYRDARSVDNNAFVITTSNVDTSLFANKLYRSNKEYCGLSNEDYEKLATEYALNNTDTFIKRMVEDLQLQLDGNCDGIFQVAAMQTGDNTEDRSNGDMLSNFVQVLSFNMESDYEASNEVMSTNVAGGFSSGYLNTVYAAQDFAATLSDGSHFDMSTGEWKDSTFILGFDITGATPRPFCYAEVDGRPRDQYSVDYYDGHLRVVTEEWKRWSSSWGTTSTSNTMNRIVALKVPAPGGGEGTVMKEVGKTGHIGKDNEQVHSVRFIGSKAYIVTFERTDPFYIFDLEDHSAMVKLGELEIPGFSSYLHPIEIGDFPLMLGVGEHVDPISGSRVGLKISLFDISDSSNPTENATFIDKNAWSSAGNDYKAFRYLEVSQKLILPKREYTYSEAGNFDGFVVYDILPNEIKQSNEIQHASSYDMYHGCWYNARMPPRSFVFKSKLTTIKSHSVISTDLNTGEKLWDLNLDERLKKDQCRPYFL